MTLPLSAAKPSPLTAEMADVLRDRGTNLRDEREVMMTLRDAKFRAGDIVACMDEAVIIAGAYLGAGS